VKADARTVLDAMTRFVGAAHCIVDPVHQQPFVTDYRRIHHGRAVAVVRPGTTQQVSDVVRWCADHRVAIVPQGGNTSLLGGAVPDDSGTSVVLSLARMNRVLCVDAVNDTITGEAGVTLEAARAAAAQHGRLFPLRIGSEGSCQIGGNLSTNAGGTAVLRYGSMRDLVLGVGAVTADGSVYRGLRGLRKDNTGYVVKQLFVGSEGSLGIITAAVLKLYPLPRASAVSLVAVRDPTAALALLGQAKASCSQWLSAFELVSGPAIDLVMHHLPGVVRPLPPRTIGWYSSNWPRVGRRRRWTPAWWRCWSRLSSVVTPPTPRSPPASRRRRPSGTSGSRSQTPRRRSEAAFGATSRCRSRAFRRSSMLRRGPSWPWSRRRA